MTINELGITQWASRPSRRDMAKTIVKLEWNYSVSKDPYVLVVVSNVPELQFAGGFFMPSGAVLVCKERQLPLVVDIFPNAHPDNQKRTVKRVRTEIFLSIDGTEKNKTIADTIENGSFYIIFPRWTVLTGRERQLE